MDSKSLTQRGCSAQPSAVVGQSSAAVRNPTKPDALKRGFSLIASQASKRLVARRAAIETSMVRYVRRRTRFR